jgi:hypothetical protein
LRDSRPEKFSAGDVDVMEMMEHRERLIIVTPPNRFAKLIGTN